MTQETKQPQRRWLRFSLRTFLIVLTIFCVWLGWYLYRVEQQREAVKWVEENGGRIYYDYQVNSDGFPLKNSQPPVPNWLLNNLDVNYFSSVVYVSNLRNAGQVSDLEPLAALANLEILYIGNSQVGDLEPLAGLANLEMLVLAGMPVSDLTPLSGLTNLKRLSLYDLQVNDEDIQKLQLALPNCQIIRLN